MHFVSSGPGDCQSRTATIPVAWRQPLSGGQATPPNNGFLIVGHVNGVIPSFYASQVQIHCGEGGSATIREIDVASPPLQFSGSPSSA